MKPFCLQNSLSFFIYLIHLCTYVYTLPWLPAHSSISQHLMNLERSKNVDIETNWQNNLRENSSGTITLLTTQTGENVKELNSNVHEKRLFHWHSITHLPFGKHLQAIGPKSMTSRLAFAKIKKEYLPKVTKKSIGIVRSEDLDELLDNLPEIFPRKSTHGKRRRKKNLRSKIHFTPVKVEQGPQQTAATSVRDCMFLPGSSCTTIHRVDLAKLSDYLNNVIALSSAMKKSEVDV
ncbi:hypothetical protein Ddc_16910 [Ditylenchus destructor]|nr:hypothetical protein Ddc_16910 [Ditylenchus destructor]